MDDELVDMKEPVLQAPKDSQVIGTQGEHSDGVSFPFFYPI